MAAAGVCVAAQLTTDRRCGTAQRLPHLLQRHAFGGAQPAAAALAPTGTGDAAPADSNRKPRPGSALAHPCCCGPSGRTANVSPSCGGSPPTGRPPSCSPPCPISFRYFSCTSVCPDPTTTPHSNLRYSVLRRSLESASCAVAASRRRGSAIVVGRTGGRTQCQFLYGAAVIGCGGRPRDPALPQRPWRRRILEGEASLPGRCRRRAGRGTTASGTGTASEPGGRGRSVRAGS